MDKGLFSIASQDILLAKLKELLNGQKAIVVLAATLLFKALFLYADDIVAEKNLPQELTDKSQTFFDAILVDKDLDKSIIIGLDLIPILYELFKKPAAIAA